MIPVTRALASAAALVVLALPAGAAPQDEDDAARRQTLQAMKEAPRGPFARIRWFCEDGTVLPPKPSACRPHGGGRQHGEWSAATRALREDGFRIANVLASEDPQAFVGPDARLEDLAQILIERFLVRIDDGWILRGARTYRGAFQAEDESAAARAIVFALLRDATWREPHRWLFLREVARGLPLEDDTGGADAVRAEAAAIADLDAGFRPLRVKIHGLPEPGDADAVRSYAKQKGDPALRERMGALADAIDALFASEGVVRDLERRAARTDDAKVAATLRESARALASAEGAEARFTAAAQQLVALREAFAATPDAGSALALLLASRVVEDETFAAGNALLAQANADVDRDLHLTWFATAATALHGAGFITGRQRQELEAAIARLREPDTLRLADYRSELRMLARAAEWSDRWLAFHFGEAMATLHRIEPLATRFSQDRLRGSPVLVAGAIADRLGRDAAVLSGVEHRLFDAKVGAGLRGLNPGLTRGVLRVPANDEALMQAGGDDIVLVSETISDLPPVAGILTRGEGNALSHVQLLARNLGIPNVVVGEEWEDEVRGRVGERVVLQVSPGGVVRIEADGPEWDEVFGREEARAVRIVPDLEKLDLDERAFLPLADLRAADSGRVSGPKGANLGELRHFLGPIVPDGFVIPFGAFRALLDQPFTPGGPPAWDAIREHYRALAAMPEGAERERAVSEFLSALRDFIARTDPGADFRRQLQTSLDALGEDGRFGVFVRSDTNVEDLPGFTGAGLNKTVPNVVGSDAIFAAVREVWASPFTERAYRWRQALMEQPEYVFPAVLVQKAFPGEKSGVLVTADLESGVSGVYSVAVSEGVGGAVDGQAAEGLRVFAETGRTQQLAAATAPWRRVLRPGGGIEKRRASGRETVLGPGEVRTLLDFAERATLDFPALREEDDDALPADIEFAFRDGDLALLQLRPFVESDTALRSRALLALDRKLEERAGDRVRLDRPLKELE